MDGTDRFSYLSANTESPHLTSPVFVQVSLNSPEARGSWSDEAERKLTAYEKYIADLYERLPFSYQRLKNFLDRGSCQCSIPDNAKDVCDCLKKGGMCTCANSKRCKDCQGRERECHARPAKQIVRVYDIDPRAKDWKYYLTTTTFDTSNPMKLEELKKKLFTDETIDEERNRTGQDNDTSKDPLEDKHEPCRLVTVSHLSPEVAKLLGAAYDISADFFNRHLPGTEAVSGRLISRLPSSLQIDLDELYEGEKEFAELWPQGDVYKDGHETIRQAIQKSFLFPVGWDYFPIEESEWLSSLQNFRLSSGYEVLSHDLPNVFQFNLTNRISVYSRPPNQPRTGKQTLSIALLEKSDLAAIILFYPTLPIYHPVPVKSKDQPRNGYERVNFRSIPNMVPRPSEMGRFREDRGTHDWEHPDKQDYASAYDRSFRLQAMDYFDKHHPGRAEDQEEVIENKKKVDHETFVHIFGAPLFRMVSANWARLIVRRSFDLDLLEWRPKDVLKSKTIEEIKSRRVAITRHQRDISASLEVLRGLMLEEQEQKITREQLAKDPDQKATLMLLLSETSSEWNRGR